MAILLGCWQPSLAVMDSLADRHGEREKLVASGDLHMAGPARRPEHGLPLGNGRMGSMVWTTPGAIHLQINRPDVYANDKETVSFHEGHDNYCGGCAFVDFDFGKAADIFGDLTTRQDLSVYNGMAILTGNGLSARMLVHPGMDVLAMELNDERQSGGVTRGILRMLRPSNVRNSAHSAVSSLREDNGCLILTQEFKEGGYTCRTAVVLCLAGAPTVTGLLDDRGMQMTLEPRLDVASSPVGGRTVLYVASAASFDPQGDVTGMAMQHLAAARQAGFAKLAEETANWWHQYWQGTYVKLTGTTSDADAATSLVQAHYYYFLYLMAASSRGPLPPKFNGMLWNTRGDGRKWGDMHWWHNVSCFYDALPATGKWDLMEPVYDMYSAMLPACGRAAREVWGSDGVWIPETVHFNGPPTLPPEIAAEMGDFMLCRKPVTDLTDGFKDFASARNPLIPYWNFMAFDCWKSGQFDFRTQGHGPFSYVSHIFSSGTKIALLFWDRYSYTRDIQWLRTRAYPVIRGSAEFYRNFPNLKLEADGKYHLHNVNNHEPTWNAHDALGELAAMYSILPVAVRASEILEVDADLRVKWKDLSGRLAPLPTTDHPQAIHPRQAGEDAKWDVGLRPVAKAGNGGIEPIMFYGLYTIETEDPRMSGLAAATYGPAPRSYKSRDVGPLGLHAVMAANMGRGEDLGAALVAQLTDPLIYPNRLCDVEGDYQELPGTSAEHEGRALHGLTRGLLLAAPAAPGRDPVVRVFGALPAAWDGEFQLLAPGGFVISAARAGRMVRWVGIESKLGETLRLRNPWPGASVKVVRDGITAPSIKGDVLNVTTGKNETLRLTME